MIELCKKEYNIPYNIIYTHRHGLSLPYRNLQSRVLAVWGIWMTRITKSDRPSLRLSFMSSSFYKNSFLLAASESDWILFDQWAKYHVHVFICPQQYQRMGKVQDSGQQITIIFLTASKYIIWWIFTCTYTLQRAMISCLILECDCVWAACSAIPRGGSLLTNNISKQHTTPKPGVTCSHIFLNIICIPLGWGGGKHDAIFSNNFVLARLHLYTSYVYISWWCYTLVWAVTSEQIKIKSKFFLSGTWCHSLMRFETQSTVQKKVIIDFATRTNFANFSKICLLIYVYCLRGCNDGW